MLTDEVLVDRVVAGFEGDFEELYRRHSQAAWRLAQAVTGNAHDAADAVAEAFARVFKAVKVGRLADGAAFRSYLLTATRNASLDTIKKGSKARPTDDEVLDLVESERTGPIDVVTGAGDAAMVAEAFRNLPERWRSVLWLTEVEGVATKDVAEQLGISANGAAQLAVRARAGLRERFLQAHLKATSAPDCRFTVDRLGAYVGGGLAPRDLAKVDQHLAGCDECRAKRDELEDVGTSLRRIVLPIPLALGGIAGARVTGALTATSSSIDAAPSAAAKVLALAKHPTPKFQRAVAASAAGLFGLGVIAASFNGGARPTFEDLTAAPADAAELAFADVELPTTPEPVQKPASSIGAVPAPVVPPAADEIPRSGAPTPAAAPAPAPAPVPVAPAPTAPPAAPPATESPEDEPDTVIPIPELPPVPGVPPVVDATIGGTLGDESVGVTVEIDDTPSVGLQVGPVLVGEDPEEPEDDGVIISIAPLGGDAIEIGLP
ncbi:MAG TPA: sigma-70 family RNA polymerase sigma factor [Acidimicrobiales bacterium]|nr:sigma-70 family RNA polymerase sigma factor [Acidimicrobiales bacterium]